MIVLDKIKAFFKWYTAGVKEFSGLKPEAEATEKKAAEAPEKKGDESSSK